MENGFRVVDKRPNKGHGGGRLNPWLVAALDTLETQQAVVVPLGRYAGGAADVRVMLWRAAKNRGLAARACVRTEPDGIYVWLEPK